MNTNTNEPTPERQPPSDELVIVEIKSYTQATGLEQVEYLEIELAGGDDLIGHYEVRQYQRTGIGRTRQRTFTLRGHRRSDGETELVRMALNEIRASRNARAA